MLAGTSLDKNIRCLFWFRGYNELMARIKLDLHNIFSNGRAIDTELNRVIQEAVSKKIELVEIIPGKGSGQLKKSVLRFLEQPQIKNYTGESRKMIRISAGSLCISGISYSYVKKIFIFSIFSFNLSFIRLRHPGKAAYLRRQRVS